MKTNIRAFAHELIDRMSPARVEALLDLLDEEFFTEEEIAEIQTLRASEEWQDWREVRSEKQLLTAAHAQKTAGHV